MGHTQGHRADSNPGEDKASDNSADTLEHAVQWCDASFQIFNRKTISDELTNISRAKALFFTKQERNWTHIVSVLESMCFLQIATQQKVGEELRSVSTDHIVLSRCGTPIKS